MGSLEKRCGTCRFWKHTYASSSVVRNDVGSCMKAVDFKKLPHAFLEGWNGYYAVHSKEGRQCATWRPLRKPARPKGGTRAAGGHARAKKLTSERRREIAKRAADARWSRV